MKAPLAVVALLFIGLTAVVTTGDDLTNRDDDDGDADRTAQATATGVADRLAPGGWASELERTSTEAFARLNDSMRALEEWSRQRLDLERAELAEEQERQRARDQRTFVDVAATALSNGRYADAALVFVLAIVEGCGFGLVILCVLAAVGCTPMRIVQAIDRAFPNEPDHPHEDRYRRPAP
jgi:hypothetical protein